MQLVKNLIAIALGVVCLSACSSTQTQSESTEQVDSVFNKQPIKLTSGPKQHWFGYYDKQQMDPTGRYVLGMEVDTFYRSPTNSDTLKIGMVDLQDNNKWIALGTSNAWGWQQGCMLQWVPGSGEEVIWNGKFVSRVLNIKTKQMRTLPKAIYTLSHDGTFALGTEFNRIQNLRPGYGYPGVEDPYADDKYPSEIGIYKLDLKTGESNMIISIAEMAKQANNGEDLTNYWHWFNHLLISPDDARFVFLHRWRTALGTRSERATTGFTTRMAVPISSYLTLRVSLPILCGKIVSISVCGPSPSARSGASISSPINQISSNR